MNTRCPSFVMVCFTALSSCASPDPEGAATTPPSPVPTATQAPPEARDSGDPEPAPPEWRFDGPILSGSNCTSAELPTWILDDAEHRVALSTDAAFTVDLAPGWSAELEQPQLLVLRAPNREQGFRPTFELFIAPVCDSVYGPAVLGRVAARAWFGTRTPDSTMHAVTEGTWPASLGGILRSLVLEVELDTPAGPQAASLYFTDYGRAETFAILAAAACPGPVPPVASERPCQSRYRAMLE